MWHKYHHPTTFFVWYATDLFFLSLLVFLMPLGLADLCLAKLNSKHTITPFATLHDSPHCLPNKEMENCQESLQKATLYFYHEQERRKVISEYTPLHRLLLFNFSCIPFTAEWPAQLPACTFAINLCYKTWGTTNRVRSLLAGSMYRQHSTQLYKSILRPSLNDITYT